MKKRFKMTLYFKKTGNHFESYIGKTRKEVEQAVRDRKKEMKNWADDEPRPTGVSRNWVLI